MPNNKFMQNFGSTDVRPSGKQRSVPNPAAGDVDPFQLMYNSSVPQEDDDDDEIYGNLSVAKHSDDGGDQEQQSDDQVLSAAQRKLDERLGGIISQIEESESFDSGEEQPAQVDESVRQSPALGRIQGLAEGHGFGEDAHGDLPSIPVPDSSDVEVDEYGYQESTYVHGYGDQNGHGYANEDPKLDDADVENIDEQDQHAQGNLDVEDVDSHVEPITIENVEQHLDPLPDKPVKKPGRQSAAYMQAMRKYEQALEERREKLSELGFGMDDDGQPLEIASTAKSKGVAKPDSIQEVNDQNAEGLDLESIDDAEVAEVVLDYVCKQTVLHLKSSYTSQIYTKDYMESLMQGYVDGNIDHSNPLFKQLISECIEHADEDPYLKGMTKLVLKWIQNN